MEINQPVAAAYAAILTAGLIAKVLRRRYLEKRPKPEPPKPIMVEIPKEKMAEFLRLYDSRINAAKVGSGSLERWMHCEFVNKEILVGENCESGKWRVIFDAQTPHIEFEPKTK